MREALAGVREIVPLAVGVAIYGLAFGLLAVQAGYSAPSVGAMGALVFAGGAQIVAAQRLVAGGGALAAAVAGIALNLRLMLITASVRDLFAGQPWWRVALGAHLATDENWALLHAERARGRSLGYGYLVGAGACLLLVWVVATTIGASFAAAIPAPRALGMDFAFTAAFIAIARSLWRGRRDLAPWLVSAGVVAGSTRLAGLDPSWALVLGGVAGAVVAGVAGRD